MTVEYQPREERAEEEDATGVSSDLQRLFEESSFGSPQAQQSYAPPPPHLVTNIVNRVHRTVVGFDLEGSASSEVTRRRHLMNALYQILETNFPSTSPPHVEEGLSVTPAICGRPDDVSPLVSDLMLLADRDADQQRHAIKPPTTSQSLTGSWWLPTGGNSDGQVNQDQETQMRLGQHAFDLAQEYLAAGKLDRARYWLTIAVEYNIQGANSLLADLASVQDPLDSPEAALATETVLGDTGAAEQGRPADVDDEVHDVDAMVRTAHEQAQAVVRQAHHTAEEILAEARSKADSRYTGTGLVWLAARELTVHQRQLDMRWWLLPSVEPCDRVTSHGEECQDPSEFKWSAWTSRHLIKLWGVGAGTPNKLLQKSGYLHVLDERLCHLRSWLANRHDETARIWDVVTPQIDGSAGPGPMLLFPDVCGRQLGLAASYLDEALRIWHAVPGSVIDDPLILPCLWTPPAAAADDSNSGAKQQPEGEQIVVGPEFRQALDKLNEQLAGTCT